MTAPLLMALVAVVVIVAFGLVSAAQRRERERAAARRIAYWPPEVVRHLLPLDDDAAEGSEHRAITPFRWSDLKEHQPE